MIYTGGINYLLEGSARALALILVEVGRSSVVTFELDVLRWLLRNDVQDLWVESAGTETVRTRRQSAMCTHQRRSGRVIYVRFRHNAVSFSHPVDRRLLKRAALCVSGHRLHVVETV